MKMLIPATVALLLLGIVSAASAANFQTMHPRSFQYIDENGVETTGIDMNLGGFSHQHLSADGLSDRPTLMHPRSFQYVDENGVETTGIDMNLGGFFHHDWSGGMRIARGPGQHRLPHNRA